MAIVFRGQKTFYEEGGRLYTDSSKRVECTPDSNETVTIDTTPTKIIETVQEESKNKCDVCGFEAKSFAGLAVHKMKHQVVNSEDKLS